MRRSSVVFGAVVLVSTLAGSAAAHNAEGLLNTLDVQRLVTMDTPVAHMTLARHFMALADTYAADAARMSAHGDWRLGNPNHPLPPAAYDRRTDLVATATAHSEAARAMAAYHQFLSIGFVVPAPAERAAFDGGYGARIPTDSEIARARKAARGAADHHVLQEFFLMRAARSEAAAARHAANANSLRAGQRRGAEIAAIHCDWLAREARHDARDARAAAELQRQLATLN